MSERHEAEFGFYPEEELWHKIYKCELLLYLKCHWVSPTCHEYFKLLTCCHSVKAAHITKVKGREERKRGKAGRKAPDPYIYIWYIYIYTHTH